MWCREIDSRGIKLIELLHESGKVTNLVVLVDIVLSDNRLEIVPSLVERDV